MFSIPNGFTVIAQRSDGFVAVHRITGKVMLGRTALDRSSSTGPDTFHCNSCRPG